MIFKKTKRFDKSFASLTAEQQDLARAVFKKFKDNPKDVSLHPHLLHRLTALRGTTIRAVTVEGNLRVIFSIEGEVITSLDIGTHDLY